MKNNQTYLVFYTDNHIDKLVTEGEIKLEVLKEIVGGYIEVVYLDFGADLILIVNEEGLLLNLAPNPFFSGIVGNVILGKSSPPEILGLTQDDINIVTATLQLLNNEVKLTNNNAFEA